MNRDEGSVYVMEAILALVIILIAAALAFQLQSVASPDDRESEVERAQGLLRGWADRTTQNGTLILPGMISNHLSGDPALSNLVSDSLEPGERIQFRIGSRDGAIAIYGDSVPSGRATSTGRVVIPSPWVMASAPQMTMAPEAIATFTNLVAPWGATSFAGTTYLETAQEIGSLHALPPGSWTYTAPGCVACPLAVASPGVSSLMLVEVVIWDVA